MILAGTQHRYWQKANAPLIDRLVQNFQSWSSPFVINPNSQQTELGQKAQRVTQFLCYEISAIQDELNTLKTPHRDPNP